jgi:hypothetical protein
MKDTLKVIESKRLRALLIKTLYDAYPGSLLKGTLKRAYSGNYSNMETDKQLEYLKGKGYIEMDSSDEQNDDNIMVKVTSLGIDLMEETIEDAGVGF